MLRAIRRPCADRLRQPRELVFEQDDVGDAFGHLRPRAHRHRHPRPLQRRHVVDAVADHRHVAPGGDQRPDQRFLLLGLDPAEDRVLGRGLRQPLLVLGQVRPLDHPGVLRHADRVGDRGHGRGGVAGDQLQVDFLLAHVGDRLAGVGPQRLLQHDQRQRRQPRRPAGGRVLGQRLAALAEGDDAPPRRRLLLQLLGQPRRQASAPRTRRGRRAPRARRSPPPEPPSSETPLHFHSEENGTSPRTVPACPGTPRRSSPASCCGCRRWPRSGPAPPPRTWGRRRRRTRPPSAAARRRSASRSCRRRRCRPRRGSRSRSSAAPACRVSPGVSPRPRR